MKYQIYPNIRTPTDLGIAYLGDPRTSIVPVLLENRIDRAEYGRRLAAAESGRFTRRGYIVSRQTVNKKAKKRGGMTFER